MPAPQYMHKLDLTFDPRVISGHYVYIFSHNNVPFYVGLGKKNRWREHFHNSRFREGHNRFRYNKIRKLLKSEEEKIQVKIVAHRLSVEEAQSLEMKLIDAYGRKCDGGTLTNISTGGESGASGNKHSQEWKDKMSLESRGRNSKTTEYLVYKAKCLRHYCGMRPHEIVKLPEYSHLTANAITGWFSTANINYNYVAPHLKSDKAIWDEKREECRGLFRKGWSCPQIVSILGLDPHFVRRSCKELRA